MFSSFTSLRPFQGLFILSSFLFFTCSSKEDKSSSQRLSKVQSSLVQTLAFVHVNVIPMTKPVALPKQTVIIQEGKITRIGPDENIQVPDGALIIDGKNAYLMPGLTDFHVHFPPEEQDYPCTLQLFLSQGITTVVNMEGNSKLLELRQRINSGKLLGPTLYTSGPFLNRPLVTTPQEVEQAVIEQKIAGYDFIKLHGELSQESYTHLMQTSRREGIRVVGHVPGNLGIAASLAAQQPLIVHAEEYLYSYFSFKRELPTSAQEIDSMVESISLATAKSGTWVSPTLTVFNEIINQVNNIDRVMNRTEMRYLPPNVLQQWTPPLNPYVKRWNKEDVIRFSAQYRVMEKLVQGLHKANVPLLVGTDCMIPAVVPGFSIHDEMNLMVMAGLPPFEVLKAATSNAAKFLGNTHKLGTLQVGKQADMVLLTANPLQDIANMKQIEGVVLKGKWLSKAQLQSAQNACLTPMKNKVIGNKE